METCNVQFLKRKFEDNELVLKKNEEGECFLCVKGSYIKLNTALYELLEIIREKHEIKELSKLVNDNHNISRLCLLIRQKVTNSRNSYIFFQVDIINKKIVNSLSSYLSIFFQKSIFPFLLTAAITGNFLYFLLENTQVSIHTEIDGNLILYYVLLIAVMIMHEFGHSSASKYYGLESNSIGFGFYIFFPVFFANVTNSWLLSKYKRIMINIGGVYFQLVINLIMILFNLYYESHIITKLINVNMFVVCYSLIPFLRNDGYWIYSDFFNISNLSTKSKTYLFEIFEKKMKIEYPLLFFSVGNIVFFFYVVYIYVKNLSYNILEISEKNEPLTFYSRLLIILFMTIFFSFFIQGNLSILIKKYGKKHQV